jgi:hypothetical protein
MSALDVSALPVPLDVAGEDVDDRDVPDAVDCVEAADVGPNPVEPTAGVPETPVEQPARAANIANAQVRWAVLRMALLR